MKILLFIPAIIFFYSCRNNKVSTASQKERWRDSCVYLTTFDTCDNCCKLKLYDSVTNKGYSSECLGKMIKYFETETKIKSKASFGFGGYYYNGWEPYKRKDLVNWSTFFGCDTTRYISK